MTSPDGRQRRRLTATETDLGVVRQRALLVGGGDVGLEEAEASLEELALLTETAGADPVEHEPCNAGPCPTRPPTSARARRPSWPSWPSARHRPVVFDEELSPGPAAEPGEVVQVDVVDRAARDPRHLRPARPHPGGHDPGRAGPAPLPAAPPAGQGRADRSRVGGGIGTRFGPGETKLEVDRRRIQQRIAKLESELRLGAHPGRAAQGPAPRPNRTGGPGRLHQRRQVDAAQPAHRRRRAGGGPALLHPRPHHPPPAACPAARRSSSPTRSASSASCPTSWWRRSAPRSRRSSRPTCSCTSSTPPRPTPTARSRPCGTCCARSSADERPRAAGGQQGRRGRPTGGRPGRAIGRGGRLGRDRGRHRQAAARRWATGCGPSTRWSSCTSPTSGATCWPPLHREGEVLVEVHDEHATRVAGCRRRRRGRFREFIAT